MTGLFCCWVHDVWSSFCRDKAEIEESMIAETVQTSPFMEQPDPGLIFGSTPGMHEVRCTLERALEDGLPVLIEGESGTGKEVIGRFLHRYSARRDGPFVKVNCGAMPVRQLESEIFGHGTGIFEAEETKSAIGTASNGTLFFDEIGEADVDLQQRLIRTFQASRSEIQRGAGQKEVSARFVCASTIDLNSKGRDNALLSELMRCFGYRVRLLPLRDRRGDLPQLCAYLAKRFARNFGRPVPHLDPAVLEAFGQWNWPGNIRELENWIARIVVFGTEEAILAGARQRGNKVDGASRRHRATRINMSFVRRSRRNR